MSHFILACGYSGLEVVEIGLAQTVAPPEARFPDRIVYRHLVEAFLQGSLFLGDLLSIGRYGHYGVLYVFVGEYPYDGG